MAAEEATASSNFVTDTLGAEVVQSTHTDAQWFKSGHRREHFRSYFESTLGIERVEIGEPGLVIRSNRWRLE